MEILETNNQDIRWKQRFQNYEKAFHRLSRAIEIVRITTYCNPGLYRHTNIHLNSPRKH